MTSNLAAARIDLAPPAFLDWYRPHAYPAYHPDTMPDLYALICEGNAMEPHFKEGDVLKFSKTARWGAGSCVAIYLRSDCVPPGANHILFCQLVSGPSPSFWRPDLFEDKGRNLKRTVIAHTTNPRESLYFKADTVLGIHKFVGVMPLEGTHNARL